MSKLRTSLNHPYFFWALLSLPLIPILSGLTSGDPKAVHQMLHPTGEFAARFMIIAMMITPLTMLFKGWRGPRWMMNRRRYLGVAAFGYAALHTGLYLIDEGTVAITGGELSKLYIWTGWLAFVIFVPLAVTSTDGWIRKLGPKWKSLQRWVYGAAVLTLAHWAALHDWGGVGPALVHFGPLLALEVYRLWSNVERRRARAAGPFADRIAKMLGVDLPMYTTFQQKIAFEDREGAIPRATPFSIDLDGQMIDWTDEERAMLLEDTDQAWLAQQMLGSIHCRHDGEDGGKWINLGWAYNETPERPTPTSPSSCCAARRD